VVAFLQLLPKNLLVSSNPAIIVQATNVEPFRDCRPKTNNHVEAYNLALKKIVNYEKSPNIYESCEIFQFQEEKSHKSYLEAKRGKPAPPRLEMSLVNYN